MNTSNIDNNTTHQPEPSTLWRGGNFTLTDLKTRKYISYNLDLNKLKRQQENLILNSLLHKKREQ